MAAPLLTSDGFACGPLWVPPFNLARGDCLQIIAPDYNGILAIGAAIAAPPAGLRITGRSHFSHGAWDTRGRLTRLVRAAPTAAEWIARTASISIHDAVALLGEFGFDLVPNIRLSHLPGNYRFLMGLAAAWACRTDVLAFTAAATDLTGRQWLTEQITTRLNRWAAIELSCPYFCEGRFQVAPSILPSAISVTAEARLIGMSA